MLEALRGSLRIPTSVTKKPTQPPAPTVRGAPMTTKTAGAKAAAPDQEASWISQSRKLIPGEALAGYVSLQALANVASNPQNVYVVLALAFLVLTILLRYIGTQDVSAPQPSKTVQWPVVVLSSVSFICLVYATGGQIFWHPAVKDQAIYGQIFAVVLGTGGPTIIKYIGISPPTTEG